MPLPTRNPARPVTPADKKMSAKHMRESIKFNKKHAAEHLKAAKVSQKMLTSKKYFGR